MFEVKNFVFCGLNSNPTALCNAIFNNIGSKIKT
jgi:hypothetical protein